MPPGRTNPNLTGTEATRGRYCRRDERRRPPAARAEEQRWRRPRPSADDRTVTAEELRQVTRANRSGKQPVVFVHGLWLLPNSWDRWSRLFERNGLTALSPGWPDDPDTVAQAKAKPEVFARKSIGDIADHYEAILRKLDRDLRSSATASAVSSPRSSPGAGSPRCPWRSTPRRSAACCRFRCRPCDRAPRC